MRKLDAELEEVWSVNNDDQAAWSMWEKAVELDPLVPEFYIAWGRSIVTTEGVDEERKQEGKRLLRLAFEIEPDNFYLERNLERLLEK